MTYRLWIGVSVLLLPFAAFAATRKLRRAGVSAPRSFEKLGRATLPRKAYPPLIWFHAASVGESLSVLALIARMGQKMPQAQFLITSGTATSAQVIDARLSAQVVHQFAPLDAPGPLERFLDHWRPDAGIFVESELWPQMLRRSFERGVKLALVNARLSERSIRRWRHMPALTRHLLEVFELILTQNDTTAEAMIKLHAPADRVARGINLKAMSGPLPVDDDLLNVARTALSDRPVWIASSTHEGEETQILTAHAKLLEKWPDLCLILVPRHPERGTKLGALITEAGLSMTRRSLGQMPVAQVFLADSMGELGTWYALGDITFLGGSLRPIGGHNPYEVAHSAGIILAGPHVTNFAETYRAMQTAGAAFETPNAETLHAQVSALFDAPERRRAARAAAKRFAEGQDDQLDAIADRLMTTLELAKYA